MQQVTAFENSARSPWRQGGEAPTVPLSVAARRSDTTRNSLIEGHTRLVPYAVNSLLRRYPTLSEADRQDILSEGYIALCRAADHYDPNRGAAFSTYAYPFLQWAGKKALARSGEYKARQQGYQVTSLHADPTEGAADPAERIADERAEEPFLAVLQRDFAGKSRQRFWDWARPHLTRRQARVLWLHSEGLSHGQIATGLHTSSQNVSNLLTAAVQRLQKAAEGTSRKRIARILNAA